MKLLLLYLSLVFASLAADPDQPKVGPTPVLNATNGYGGTLTIRTQLNLGPSGSTFTLTNNGSFIISGPAGTTQDSVAASSGHTGTGLKVKTDDGTYKYLGINFTFTNLVMSNITATTITDIYTVPAGYRATFFPTLVTTNTTVNATYNLLVKPSGGSYMTFFTNVTLSALSVADLGAATIVGLIWEPGDTLATYISTNGIGISLTACLISTNIPLKTARLMPVTSGTTTLYTVPAGKRAIPTVHCGLSAVPGNLSKSLFMFNFQSSGSAITYTIGLNGGLGAVRSAVNNGNSSTLINLPSLNENDVLTINSPSSDTTQLIWMNFYEIDM